MKGGGGVRGEGAISSFATCFVKIIKYIVDPKYEFSQRFYISRRQFVFIF